MSRCLIVAPIARNLALEFGGTVVPIPNATNGVVRAWDSMDRERYVTLADPDLSLYTRRRDVPSALRPFLITAPWSVTALLVGAVEWLEAEWRQWSQIPATGYVRVRLANLSIVVKQKSAFSPGLGDRLAPWAPIHDFAGVPDEMGSSDE